MAYWDRHLYNIESPFNKESSYQIQVHCNSWVYGILFLNYCVLLHLWFSLDPMVRIPLTLWSSFVHILKSAYNNEYSCIWNIYLCWYDIPELVVSVGIFRDRGLLLTRKLLNQGLLLVRWDHHFESFTVAIMTRLIAMEYLRHKWPRICSTCSKHSPVLSSFMAYHRHCN